VKKSVLFVFIFAAGVSESPFFSLHFVNAYSKTRWYGVHYLYLSLPNCLKNQGRRTQHYTALQQPPSSKEKGCARLR